MIVKSIIKIFKPFQIIAVLSVSVVIVLFLQVNLSANEDKPDMIVAYQSELAAMRNDNAAFDLLRVIDDMTEIATKTKINADFVPGMVTVLYGEDLESRGFCTVLEALSIVPGVELSILSQGTRKLVMRGVGGSAFSGNIKLLINGAEVNFLLSGMSDALMELPIEQIDRIEIIRGPGSAVHGEFAYVGVINMITRKTGNRFFGRMGSFDTYAGGGLISWSDPEKELFLNMNLAIKDTNGTDRTAGPDRLHAMGMENISNAPGFINESKILMSGIFNMEYKDFSVCFQSFEGDHGTFFGTVNTLSLPDDRNILKSTDTLLDINQKIEFHSTAHVIVYSGWRNSTFSSDQLYAYPPGFMNYQDGLLSKIYYMEDRLHGGADFTWEGFKNHALLLGLSISRTSIMDAWQETNFLPLDQSPITEIRRFSGDENWIEEGITRTIKSVTVQDEFYTGYGITFTSGLRFDDYRDVDESISPRIAAVWHMAEYHILKAQYGRAFRPPTFMEIYGRNNPVAISNPDIDPSIINTYEVGYIFKRNNAVCRTSVFYSDLNDLITAENNNVFDNTHDAKLKGVEFEFEQKIYSLFNFAANISYVDTKTDTGNELPGAMKWLSNVCVLYQPYTNYLLTTKYHYTGKRSREFNDSRDDLKDAHTIDIAGSILQFFFRGLKLRAGIHNIFDEDIRYPAPVNTYSEDYPRPGRSWWLQLSYDY